MHGSLPQMNKVAEASNGVIDSTAHFSGNESPASEVWGARDDGLSSTLAEASPLWEPLVPRSPLGPSSRHLFLLPTYSAPLTHLKLTMHPDGGIARFRAYGQVIVPSSTAQAIGGVLAPGSLPSGPYHGASLTSIDLAATAECVGESDQHFGMGSNLLLPGRGKDMGDGWETKRSRGRLATGQGDWVVVKLCAHLCLYGRSGYCKFFMLMLSCSQSSIEPKLDSSSGPKSIRIILSATFPIRLSCSVSSLIL